MKKEEILKKSREENIGRCDERELAALGAASRIGLGVGGLLCVALILISEFLLKTSMLAIAGWMVYLGMFGSQKLVLYKYLGKKSDLFFGIGNIIVAIIAMVLIVVKV